MTSKDQAKLVLEGIVGSHAYGLNRPESDRDRLGVYVAPAEDFLGLHVPQDKSATIDGKDPDYAWHELRKYLRLCLACNPTVMELLWLEDGGYTVRTPIGEDLISLRQAVLSRRRVEDAYLGYATQQFERIRRREERGEDQSVRIEKHARHLMRLVRQGVSLWRTGHLTLRVEKPEDYFAFGREVAAGELDRAEMLLNWARAIFDSEERSGLPEAPDEEGVNAWLTRTRLYDHRALVRIREGESEEDFEERVMLRAGEIYAASPWNARNSAWADANQAVRNAWRLKALAEKS